MFSEIPKESFMYNITNKQKKLSFVFFNKIFTQKNIPKKLLLKMHF